MNNLNDEFNDIFSGEEREKIIFASTFLSFAKYIKDKELESNDININEFFSILKSIGTESYTHIFNVCSFSEIENSVKLLIDAEDYVSTVLLIATALETHINNTIRSICIVKGFSHKEITEYVSNIKIKTKLNFILPLLGIEVCEKYKDIIHQYFSIRNEIAHNKAIPKISSSERGDEDGSYNKNKERSKSLVMKYPFNTVLRVSIDYDNFIMDSLPEFKKTYTLYEKYFFEKD